LKENAAESLGFKGLTGFDEHFYAEAKADFCIKVFSYVVLVNIFAK
jgi:hypothetical protein